MNAKEQNKNALAQWDASEILWSIEMGGLGPSYEQCIQASAWEIIRDNINKTLKKSDWKKFGEKTLNRIDKKFGHSGGTWGSAKWLAWRILDEGYDNFIERARKDKEAKKRLIQIDNTFEKVA
jgi:hypothetical protein